MQNTSFTGRSFAALGCLPPGLRRPLFAILSIAAVAALSGCDEPAEGQVVTARPVRALTVGDDTAIQGRWFSGRARAAREASIAFRVPGRVMSLPVAVGDQVEQGEIIARLDSSTFQEEVQRLEAELARAEAILDNASLQAQRTRTLVDRGHETPSRLDERTAEENSARATVRATEAGLRRARLDLGFTELYQPFPGIVVAIFVQEFEEVRAQEPVIRVLDPSRIEMVVNIPETLISQARFVETARIVFDAFPGTEVPAEIVEIGNEASATTRTFPVTLVMDQPEAVEILPGMAGRATAVLRRESGSQSGIVVPVSATFGNPDDPSSGESGTFVWVIDPETETVSARPVEPGVLTAYGLQITDGLDPGEAIVTAGIHSLRDGQPVRIIEP